jgi:cell division transport system permease protein
MFSNLEFFIREAWIGFRRGGIMSLVAIGTITVSLVILGIFLLVIFNFNNLVSSISSRMEVLAYINSDIDEWTKNKVQVEIMRIKGVAEIEFIGKDEAWQNFKSEYKEKMDLSEIIKDNPLPNTFIVRLSKPEMAKDVAQELLSIAIINEVRYSGNLAERMELISNALRLLGMVLVGLLGLGTLLIIVNTIRLTVLARETDITIMRLVGATDSFVRWPFIIEGVIIGIIGSAMAFILLKLSYDTAIVRLQMALPFFPFLSSQYVLTMIYLLVAVSGTFLGMLGGYISVNRSLKEQI